MTALLEAPGLVRPAHFWCPEYGFTSGPEVADVAELAGMPPDPQQRLILDVVFAETRSGRPAVFEVDVLAPRRNLKTGVGKMSALGWLYLLKVERVVYTAHEWNPAIKQMFGDMKKLVDSNAWLSKRVRRIYEGNGEESIDFKSGSQMLFRTRTKAGGQGGDIDKLILDEGLEVQEQHTAALFPTMAVRQQRQVLVLSSAGKSYSEWLRERRDSGRAGGDPEQAWIEWCMPPPEIACELGAQCDHGKRTPGCGLDNPEMLVLSNPTLSTPRLELQSLRQQRSTLSPLKFAREFGGWWDEPAESGARSPFDIQRWGELEDPYDEDQLDYVPPPEVMNIFGVELDLDRAFGSIGAAGVRDDERKHIEVVDRRRGTGWIIGRAKHLDEHHGPAVFVIDGGGPAADLIPKFEEEGLTVFTLGGRDVAAAAAGIVDAVNDGTLVHGPDELLDAAVAGAKKRSLGDGGFALGRIKSDVDVTPLVACANAMWVLGQGSGVSVFFFADLAEDEEDAGEDAGDDD